jgi:hypothetical protein
VDKKEKFSYKDIHEKCSKLKWKLQPVNSEVHMYWYIPVNPPPFRGSLPHKSLISRIDWVSCAGDINLLHTPFPPARPPPTKKSSTIQSWPIFCDQYFWKFPIWNSRADEKRREIRMVKVFKWYPVIDLFDTFTGKLGHGN